MPLLPFIDRSGPLGKPLRLVGLILIVWFMFEIYRLQAGSDRPQEGAAQLFHARRADLLRAAEPRSRGILQLFGGFGLEPGLGSYFSLPWVVLTFYAITRYRLFDIRIIISRTVTISPAGLLFSLIQIGFFQFLEPLVGHYLDDRHLPALHRLLFLRHAASAGTSRTGSSSWYCSTSSITSRS